MTVATQAENSTWTFPFSQAEWEQTPGAVQTHLLTLQTQLGALQQQHQALQIQVDHLQGRVDQTSQTSSKPPSSDSPFKKTKRGGSSGKRGGRQGHPGSGPIVLEPTDVRVIHPNACECGHIGLVTSVPYHTHQVIELPPIEMQITHFELHQEIVRFLSVCFYYKISEACALKALLKEGRCMSSDNKARYLAL
jgi:transposase